MLEYLLGFIILFVAVLITYVSIHMEQEKYEGKTLPLPWEKGGWMRGGKPKIFNKSDVVYRDGDNT